MRCLNCQTENPKNAKYCQKCGNSLKNDKKVVLLMGVWAALTGLGLFISNRSTCFLLSLALTPGIYLYFQPVKFAKKFGKASLLCTLPLLVFSLRVNFGL